MSLRTATLAASLMLAAPAAAIAAPLTETVETTQAPARAKVAESHSYAEREARDQKVESYEGGSTVVIAMSGTALVVLLVLLLLL